MTALDPDSGGGSGGRERPLEAHSVTELRRLRVRLQRREDDQSLRRRLVQGRLDIVRAEQQRRTLGGDGGLQEVLAALPATLAGPVESAAPSRARRPPTTLDASGGAELDAVCGIDELRRLPDLATEDLEALAGQLVELERAASEARQQMHRALDAVGAELARRYISGEASVDDLLGPLIDEG
jgi:hypothetical protein